jgi:alanine dehydrogenase
MVPASVKELVSRGHNVIVQQGDGLGIGVSDQAYKDVGAAIINAAKDIFFESDLIVKVKEPLKEECAMLRSGQTIFAFLHLAAEPALSELLINTGVISIAYETVTDASGHLPLLAPMSEIAGKISMQLGAGCLEKVNGGKGILLSGVPGVASGNVVVIGGGCAGSNAIRVALQLLENC